MVVMALCSVTDLVIRGVGRVGTGYRVESGSLYNLFVAHMVLFGFGGLSAVALKRSRSRSIDRARATYILLGFGLFLTLALLLVVALPEIMGIDTTSDTLSSWWSCPYPSRPTPSCVTASSTCALRCVVASPTS